MVAQVTDEIGPLDHPAAGARNVIIALLAPLMPKLAPQSVQLSIVYEPVDAGWVQARIEEFPEVITAGRTKGEARTLVLDALREYLLSLRGNGEADRELVDLLIPS